MLVLIIARLQKVASRLDRNHKFTSRVEERLDVRRVKSIVDFLQFSMYSLWGGTAPTTHRQRTGSPLGQTSGVEGLHNNKNPSLVAFR